MNMQTLGAVLVDIPSPPFLPGSEPRTWIRPALFAGIAVLAIVAL
jgi:hypothetical protein